MKENTVCLELEKYNKMLFAEQENAILRIEIEKLEEIKEKLSDEIEDLLDGITKNDDEIYKEKLYNFNINCQEKIARFLTDKGYLELIKEIKKRKGANNNE